MKLSSCIRGVANLALLALAGVLSTTVAKLVQGAIHTINQASLAGL